MNESKSTDKLRYQITFLQIANSVSMTENLQSRSKSIQRYLIANRNNVSEKLQEPNVINTGHVQLCLPFVRALTSGAKTRFPQRFNNLNLSLISALHPHFKLVWLTRLEENEFGLTSR